MPKMKTHQGTAKRFKRTGAGALRRRRAGHNHLAEHKTSARQRRGRRSAAVAGADQRRVRRLLGH